MLQGPPIRSGGLLLQPGGTLVDTKWGEIRNLTDLRAVFRTRVLDVVGQFLSIGEGLGLDRLDLPSLALVELEEVSIRLADAMAVRRQGGLFTHFRPKADEGPPAGTSDPRGSATAPGQQGSQRG